MPKPAAKPDPNALLKGWQQIATFLGIPTSTAQRWAKTGMPVMRDGRRIEADRDELNRWMERETHEPVHIATDSTDLSAELRRGLAYVKKEKRSRKTAA